MITVYEAKIERALDDLGPLVQRLVARNKIPRHARIETLHEAHIGAALHLHEEFSCPARVARLRLEGLASIGNYCRKRSVVLTVDGSIGGILLVQSTGSADVAFIYGVAVIRQLRGTWANAFLKHRALMHLSSQGVSVVRFQAEDSGRDTHKHAARVNAVKVLVESLEGSFSEGATQD